MTAILAEFGPWLAGIAALVAGWFAAKHSGRTAERNARNSARLDAIKEKQKVKDDVEKSNDDDLVDGITRRR